MLYFLSGIAFIILKYTPGFMPQFVVKAILIPFLILLFYHKRKAWSCDFPLDTVLRAFLFMGRRCCA